MIRHLALLFLLTLIGCSSTDLAPNPDDPDVPTPAPSGDCTSVISGSVNLPTKWVDGPAACDYLLEGTVAVNSTLTIEPGVTIRAALSSRLVIEGADFKAVGKPDKRIVFEGQKHNQGHWAGINLKRARPSRIEYVDIKDAGQTCESCDGGLQLESVSTSLTHSTVSNSSVNGLYTDGNVEFTAFANNRFYGNAFAGVVTASAEEIVKFDKASDFIGIDQPNGLAHIAIPNDALDFATDRVWKKLNAPYYVKNWLKVKKGSLTLEPGVEMIFGNKERFEKDLQILDAEFSAIGTPSEPIVFRGEEAKRGYWSGIYRSVNNGTGVFKHIQIRDGYDGILLEGENTIALSDSSISNTINGVRCDATFDPAVIQLGSNVTIEAQNSEIDTQCTVEKL